MDILILGSLREKLNITFNLLDLEGKGQVTFDIYTSFITQYLNMYEEMIETQIKAANFKSKTASDFESIAYSGC